MIGPAQLQREVTWNQVTSSVLEEKENEKEERQGETKEKDDREK